MKAPGINNFEDIVSLAKGSNFFCEKESKLISNPLLVEIKIESINLPFRLQCFAHKQSIITLEELLNIRWSKILRCRNIGIGTIIKSRKIIIDHLNNMEDCFRNLETEEKNFVVTYFPLLQGFFRTSGLNFNFVYKDLSCIKIPKRIEDYINKNKGIKIIYDLLNINYDELRKEQNIGHKTLGKLQSTLFSLLGLEKVIFLSKPKRYEIIIFSKAYSSLPLNFASVNENRLEL